MKKLLFMIPLGMVAAAVTTASQPAFAAPTCEQEIRIRCSGFNVQGRPRLDIYYDSFEECVEQETATTCPPRYDANAKLDLRIEKAIMRAIKADRA